jgi:hypothetical protein
MSAIVDELHLHREVDAFEVRNPVRVNGTWPIG